MKNFTNPVGSGTLWFHNLSTADGTPLAFAGAESVQPDLVELGRAALASGAAETARNGLWRAEPVRAEPGAEALVVERARHRFDQLASILELEPRVI